MTAVNKFIRLPPFFQSPNQYSKREKWTTQLNTLNFSKNDIWKPIKQLKFDIKELTNIKKTMDNTDSIDMEDLMNQLKLKPLHKYSLNLGPWFFTCIALLVLLLLFLGYIFRERIGKLLLTDRTLGITNAIINEIKDDMDELETPEANIEIQPLKPNTLKPPLSLSVNK